MKTLIALATALLLGTQAQAENIELQTTNYNEYNEVRTPVTFMGFAKIKPGKEKEFAAIVESFVGTMRAQTGNIAYDYHQSLANGSEFVFVEEWKTGKDMVDHMNSQAVNDLVSKVGPLFASPLKIVILKKN